MRLLALSIALAVAGLGLLAREAVQRVQQHRARRDALVLARALRAVQALARRRYVGA